MLLLIQRNANLVLIGSMIFSLVIIIASIRWIKDLYKPKPGNKREISKPY